MDGPVSIRLVWYAPDARTRDSDSLYFTLKACVDALVKGEIIPDDNSKFVAETICGPVVVSRDNPRLELVITRRLDE